MGTRVFWIEPSGLVDVSLSRFNFDERCSGTEHGHSARVVIEAEAPRAAWVEDMPNRTWRAREENVAADDARWPTHCERCGAAFVPTDHRSVHVRPLYAGAPDGKLYALEHAPVGACYDCHWMNRDDKADFGYTGPDGIALCVVTPGGPWMVDSEGSNCTRPQRIPVEGKPGVTRFERTHYCWVRHGDPRAGVLHVDKNGASCAAGAGSIIAGGWHGFLHNSELVPC